LVQLIDVAKKIFQLVPTRAVTRYLARLTKLAAVEGGEFR
jgi:hypothetical protein